MMRPASRADGTAHREFLLAGVRARDQKVRGVDARDEQHQRHRAEENQQRLARVADD